MRYNLIIIIKYYCNDLEIFFRRISYCTNAMENTAAGKASRHIVSAVEIQVGKFNGALIESLQVYVSNTLTKKS